MKFNQSRYTTCDCTSVSIPVLLGKLCGKRQCDMHLTIGNRDKLRAEHRHQPLRLKALRDSLLEMLTIGWRQVVGCHILLT